MNREHPRSTPHPGGSQAQEVTQCATVGNTATMTPFQMQASAGVGVGVQRWGYGDERAAGVRFVMLEMSCLDRGGGDANSKR